jgi:hypothetical protein
MDFSDGEGDGEGDGLKDNVVGGADGVCTDAGGEVLGHEDGVGRIERHDGGGAGGVEGSLVGFENIGDGLFLGIHAGRDSDRADGPYARTIGLWAMLH